MSEEVVSLIVCPRCGQEKIADIHDPHICVDCAKVENSRYSYLRQHQGDWMEAAKDAGVDPWLQQPGETQWEYTVWVAYRDAYPGKKPTYGDVAKQLGTTRGVVGKIAQRWTFQARMQAWMAECDRITMEQRQREILDMNKDHIDMAQRLRGKLSEAIDNIDPLQLKPGELSSLMKMATDLERKALVDTVAQEDVQRSLVRDTENPNLKKSPTKQSDLSEVMQILLKAGAFGTGSGMQIGMRETTTREILAVDPSGNSTLVEVDNE